MVSERRATIDASTHSFRIGDWQVFPDQDRICHDTEAVHLEPRMMELLVYLARRAGRVVSKNEIIDAVWQQQIVSNSALSRCMALLRKSIGDDARQPTYIETIPKRGYRLIAEVEDIEFVRGSPEAIPSKYHVRFGGRDIPLEEGENVVGRSPDATVFVDSPKVSRRHARIVVDDSTVTLEDTGSKNGTFLGGILLTAPKELVAGDEILVGSIVLQFVGPDTEAATETVSNSDHEGAT